jgi:hypothetical protein
MPRVFLFAKHAAERKIGVREQFWLCKKYFDPVAVIR